MRRKQLGISLGGIMVGGFIFIMFALLGMKLVPSYIEYFAIKKAVTAIAMERRTGSPSDIRKVFDQRASVDDINTVKGADLEITKEGSDIVINAAYRKEIPLFGNAGLYINFAASSKE
jgi:hypothetical protein